jgi:large subunit ribosomal protein L18
MKKKKKLFIQAKKRSFKKIVGTPDKPRLSVFRSHKHIYAQLIDDTIGHTLVFSSTLNNVLKLQFDITSNQAASFCVGQNLGKQARAKQITKVVFDRGNRPYHGRIKKVAEGAREQGLLF